MGLEGTHPWEPGCPPLPYAVLTATLVVLCPPDRLGLPKGAAQPQAMPISLLPRGAIPGA